jgi:hypothetical protein
MLNSGKARDLISYLEMTESQSYLSCAMVDGHSQSTQKFGTGWKGDICYLFSLEEYAAKSLVFTGDVDQPTHEGPVEKRTMFVKAALLISALYNYVNIVVEKLRRTTSYDELLLFAIVDFNVPYIKKLALRDK